VSQHFLEEWSMPRCNAHRDLLLLERAGQMEEAERSLLERVQADKDSSRFGDK
jgi:hypothetical protein